MSNDYFSTIGLNVELPNYVSKTRKLVRIACERVGDSDTWVLEVISGHNLAPIKKLGKVTLTTDQLNDIRHDDDVENFRNFAGLFDIFA